MKAYVGGIPYHSIVDDIQCLFEGCGTITKTDCLKFQETGWVCLFKFFGMIRGTLVVTCLYFISNLIRFAYI